MLWPKHRVEERAAEILQEKNLSPQEVLQRGTTGQLKMLSEDPQHWRRFGPWWPRVKAILLKYQGQKAAFCADWGGDPDFLRHYTYGSDLLDWVAAFEYLDRDGFWDVHKPHLIQMPDGSERLYDPAYGFLDLD